MMDQPELQQGWDELSELYRKACELLERLDRLGLHQAGAHLSLAMEAMRQRHPHLPSYE